MGGVTVCYGSSDVTLERWYGVYQQALPDNIACFWLAGGDKARKEILSCDGFGTLRRIFL